MSQSGVLSGPRCAQPRCPFYLNEQTSSARPVRSEKCQQATFRFSFDHLVGAGNFAGRYAAQHLVAGAGDRADYKGERLASEAPAGDEIAAAIKTADQSQTEIPQPTTEVPGGTDGPRLDETIFG
jgi:hypothetical protein